MASLRQVPLGANYRLIDIPVSNCINSNVNKVGTPDCVSAWIGTSFARILQHRRWWRRDGER